MYVSGLDAEFTNLSDTSNCRQQNCFVRAYFLEEWSAVRKFLFFSYKYKERMKYVFKFTLKRFEATSSLTIDISQTMLKLTNSNVNRCFFTDSTNAITPLTGKIFVCYTEKLNGRKIINSYTTSSINYFTFLNQPRLHLHNNPMHNTIG